MNANDPRSWPVDFDALRRVPPDDWVVIEAVLDPLLRILRRDNGLAVELSARLNRKRGPLLLSAPTIHCDWVCGEGIICPLPRDVAVLVKDVLAGLQSDCLTFPQALALQREASGGISVELDTSVLVPANEAVSRCGVLAIPKLNATLFPYQAQGIAWMHDVISRTGGLVLADEMGLGKTLQVIGLLLLNPPVHESPALVVCPTTLIVNWVRELARFAPSLDVVVHRGPDRARLHQHLQRSCVVITTYDTLVNDHVLFKAIEWAWLICDEAQAIKNPDSLRRLAVADLNRRRTIPVTGTPVENHLLDLWSLVDVAISGLLGDRRSFERIYSDTEESARELALITSPFVLKRRVRDVAKDLPERMDIPVPLELGWELAERYEGVRIQALEKYLRAGAMVATGQLQLFCAHPSLTAPEPTLEAWEDEAWSEESEVFLMTPKLHRAVELIGEAFANKRKVLLFSNFNACGPIIKRAFGNSPLSYWGEINGSTPTGLRQQVVDDFSAHEGPGILILNPRAAGAGLNITAATMVIHYTQVWNPALEQQASARAYRRGQEHPVTIYHMYYAGTVEEVMMDRAQRRREMGGEAVPITAQEDIDLSRALSLSPLDK